MDESFERRLDDLRIEGLRNGRVEGSGVRAAGGPLPAPVSAPGISSAPGYYGLPIVKPPVWEWMIAVYFFVGGLAGMSGLIALAALVRGESGLARVAMWPAAAGAILSPILLTWDLGRPKRFLHMLRVFKYQSPMSLGSWILTGFGAFAVPGCIVTEWQWQSGASFSSAPLWQAVTYFFLVGSGLCGVFLATYTGALLAVTAVPAWNVHRRVLPFHFGLAGLGSAAALLELIAHSNLRLSAIGWFAAGAETLVYLWLELRKHGPVDQALHEGKGGWLLRAGEVLEGPLPLLLRGIGLVPGAAVSFLLGALLARFGWLLARLRGFGAPKCITSCKLRRGFQRSALHQFIGPGVVET